MPDGRKSANKKRALPALWRGLFCLALAILFALLSACEATPEPEVRQFFAMDTFMELKAYGDGAGAALAEAEEYVKKLGGLSAPRMWG